MVATYTYHNSWAERNRAELRVKIKAGEMRLRLLLEKQDVKAQEQDSVYKTISAWPWRTSPEVTRKRSKFKRPKSPEAWLIPQGR